jgi:Zn-dependent protease
MAIVGPITSVLIGVVLIWLAGTLGGLGAAVANPIRIIARLSPLATLLIWLGSVNVLVGIFNMIPGFPLDGGRVLRSILWAITSKAFPGK